MEVQGRIYKVLPTRSGTKADGSTWESQEFIFEFFETPDQRWSDKVVLSVMNERIKEYDLHEGDEVKIGFSHGVNEWKGRYYPEFRIYKFEKMKAAVVQQQTEPQVHQTQQAPAPAPLPAAEAKEDDLPF